jgi:hypothetical protein
LRKELGIDDETELLILKCGDYEYLNNTFSVNRGDRNITFLLKKKKHARNK